MKSILNRLTKHETLSYEEAKQTLLDVSTGKYNEYQVTCFLTVFMMRSITVNELQGFRDALLELCVPVELSQYDPVDLCGTGGDGKNTFNVSTLASLVTAGAGIKVAKHGNYGVSSACGSSNVLEYIGVKFSSEQQILEKQLDQAGICFMHAPLFHPALKNAAPIRRNLGIKTFFNMLGPMVNPARPKKQLVGVFSMDLARIYGYLYQQSDKQFAIVHSVDGYDEVSLTGDVKLVTQKTETMLDPSSFGIEKLQPEEIYGGETVEEAAKIFTNVLNGDGTTAQNSAVCANAAMAILCVVPEIEIMDAFLIAKKSLESGAAKQALNKLIELS